MNEPTPLPPQISPKQYRRRFIKGFSLGVFVTLAVWWFRSPSYLEIKVPAPLWPNGDTIWDAEERSTRKYFGSMGSRYVYRCFGHASADYQGWATQAEAMAHFDNWFKARGWLEITSEGTDASHYAVPETEYLRPREEFRIYVRSDEVLYTGPDLIVAIRPIGTESLRSYLISVTTVTPSWLRQVDIGMD